jgi:hypothetical protein
VKVQFVGDELRFAFRSDIPQYARKVRDFVDAVFRSLMRLETGTHLKGVVLLCSITWQDFLGCRFFDGPPVIRCTDWLGYVPRDRVALNKEFKEALAAEMIPTETLEEHKCGSETGFLLPLTYAP